MEVYLDNTIRWVKEIWRVLKPTGSFVLNIGDCFIGGAGRWGGDKNFNGIIGAQKTIAKPNKIPLGHFYISKQLLSVSSFAYCRIISETDFVCRGEHIWAKPNVPSPIRSRLKHSHEKLFWFVKDADEYYFDQKAWMKKVSVSTNSRVKYVSSNFGEKIGIKSKTSLLLGGRNQEHLINSETIEHSWRIIPVGEKQKGFENCDKPDQMHVAPFPTALIKPYIQSLCPENGTVIDPFLGSGTTMRIAMEENRNCIGIDLNKEYLDYAKKRVNWGAGLGIEYEEK